MLTIGARAHTINEIREVAKFGYKFIEISANEPAQLSSELNTLLEIKSGHNSEYLAHYPNEGMPNDLNALRNIYLPKLKDLITISKELNISKGTIHFLMDTRWLSPEVIAAKIDMLHEMTAHAEKFGITLCLENLTERVDSFLPVMAAVDKLRMTLDIGHGELLSKTNTSFGFIDKLFDRIAHMHVHDNHGGKDVKDDLHLALGHGRVDYPAIFTQLKNKGYESTITMEVKPADMSQTYNEIKRYI